MRLGQKSNSEVSLPLENFSPIQIAIQQRAGKPYVQVDFGKMATALIIKLCLVCFAWLYGWFTCALFDEDAQAFAFEVDDEGSR